MRSRTGAPPAVMSPEQAAEVIHELRAGQVELETQNKELRRAQAELEAARERYFELYELAPVGYLTLSEQGTIVEANLTAATLLGVTKGALLQQAFGHFVLPDDQDVFHHFRNGTPNAPGLQQCELRLKRPDGNWFWALVATTATGAPGCRLVVSDITDHKRLEGKHAGSQDLLQSVISSSTDIIFVKDMQLRTILCNQSYARAVGKRPAEMYGKNDIENGWLPELVKGIPTLGIRGFEQDDKDALSGKTVHNPADHAHVGGEPRIFDTTKVPLRDAGGEVVGVIGIARDVTDRARIEESLRIKDLAIESSSNGIGLADPDGRITYVNRTLLKMWGYDSSTEVLGKPLTVLWATEEQPREAMAHIRVRGSWFEERKARRRDGSLLDVQLSAHLVKDKDGRPVCLMASFVDITERKLLDQTQTFLLRAARPGSGENFFESLARYLASTLDMDYVCIDRLDGDGLTARTVAIYNDGAFDTNVSYALKDTPCGDVVGKAICCFPRNVSALFPNDAALQDLKSESYIGTTLWGSDGKPIGLIALISRKPLTNPALAEAVLKLAAVRAAGDLERTVAEERLRQAHDTLEQRVLQRTAELHEANVALEQEMAQRQTTEVSLRSSEERYRRITEGITDYLYNVQVKDGVAVSTTHNQACEVVTGYAIDEFSANPLLWAAMIPQADRESVLECVRTMLAGGTTQTIEHRIIRKSGEVRWVSATMLPHVDKTGTLLSYDGVIKDITARRTMEEALRLSEEKYRMVADYNHDWEYWLNPAGEFIYVSPSCMRISGYAPHDFKHDRDLLAKITHPDDRVIVETILADAVRGSTGTCQSLDLRVIGKDGTERWVNHACRPVTGSNGVYLGIRGSLREITDRKQMESDLADNERFLRQLTENIQEIFFP